MPAKKHKRPIFYDILGVTPDATADEIKKAYRKQARAKHPDKNKGDPKAAEEFKQLTAAYDILSDPKKRKEYDALGDSGVKLFAASVNDMGAVSPEALSAMMRTQLETLSPAQRGLVVCLFCCTFALVWIFPVFLCLRADDTTHWNWAIVFIPLWIVDLFLLPCFFMNDANGKPMAKFTVVTSIVLFIMQQIFLVLRLEKTVDWPWIVVLLPWAFLEVIGMWNELQGAHERFFAFQQVQTADRNAMTYSPNFFIFVLWRCTNHLARLGFAITLALKVDDSIRANWFVVMLPLWLGFAAQAGFLCWRRAVVVPPEAAAERSHLDEDSPTAADSPENICCSGCGYLLLLITMLLLAARLASKEDDFSVFLILLPLIIPLFCLCCLISLFFCVPEIVLQGGRQTDGGPSPESDGSSPYGSGGDAGGKHV